MASILVVDDQASARVLVRQLLEGEGHAVTEASNGVEAVRALSPALDLVVTDVIMPEMDGLEVVRHVKNFRADLPVIVLTGGWNAAADLLSVARRLGADRAISKGRIHAALKATVADVLARRPERGGEGN
jgi:CheY-like chemotaxis protein